MYKHYLLKLFFCSLLLLLSGWAMAQKVTITGRVTDDKGQPLPGVTITIKQTSNGANTDIDGKYSISANKTDVLVFTMIGFVKQEITVGSRTEINITLSDDNKVLNEVVVIGYGVQKRRDVTGSVASVKGETFKDQPITNPIAGLQGRTAGVDVIDSSGQPGAQPSIIIRGLSSLNQPNPLYIVDGVRASDVSTVNPQDVASIDVLKDASAASIYGSAAAGGVIIITTKKTNNTQNNKTKPKQKKKQKKNNNNKQENKKNPQFFKYANQQGLDTLAY